jgi:hypothetical protein
MKLFVRVVIGALPASPAKGEEMSGGERMDFFLRHRLELVAKACRIFISVPGRD